MAAIQVDDSIKAFRVSGLEEIHRNRRTIDLPINAGRRAIQGFCLLIETAIQERRRRDADVIGFSSEIDGGHSRRLN